MASNIPAFLPRVVDNEVTSLVIGAGVETALVGIRPKVGQEATKRVITLISVIEITGGTDPFMVHVVNNPVIGGNPLNWQDHPSSGMQSVVCDATNVVSDHGLVLGTAYGEGATTATTVEIATLDDPFVPNSNTIFLVIIPVGGGSYLGAMNWGEWP